MKKFFKLFAFLLIAIVLSFIGLQAFFYATAPVYRFDEPKAFHGDILFNPYADIDENDWLKANFQLQSRAWGGITNGRKNQNDSVKAIYRKLGYDIAAISDYQKINYFEEDSAYFIPTYEHGYNIFKTHQVCIGSQKVHWRDYLCRQNLSQKQGIIDMLRPDNEIIALAHPDLRDGYWPEDFKYLGNYDMIEVLNGARNSVKHWDSALSAGHFAPILSNDDAHDISNADEVGIRATFINAPQNEKDLVIKAMKAGKTYGLRFYRTEDEGWEEKIRKATLLPHLRKLEVQNDSIMVVFSQPMNQIRFIGQNGKMLGYSQNTDTAFYLIKDTDTYVRTEAIDSLKNWFYLNPVVRTENGKPQNPYLAHIDKGAGYLNRAGAVIALLLILLIAFRIRRKWKRKNRKRRFTRSRY